MTGPAAEPPHSPTVGPLALEAALLLDVVADRLTSMKASATVPDSSQPGATGATGATSADSGAQNVAGATASASADGRCPECGSVPGASCTACPLCRFMALLRGERPEATARLVDGALMIIRTLRSLVPDLTDPAAPSPADPSASHAGQPRPSQSHPGQPHVGQPGPAAQHPSQSHPSQSHPSQPHPSRHGGLEHIDIL